MPTAVGAGPGPELEPGTQYRLPTWVAEIQVLPLVCRNRQLEPAVQPDLQPWPSDVDAGIRVAS